MQLTIAKIADPEIDAIFTLFYPVDLDDRCPICENRLATWRVDEASDAAMNPSVASPVEVPAICATCLNLAIDEGSIIVIQVSPEAF